MPLDQLPPSVLLSKCTGLRRSELKRVKGRDLLQENGVTYVLAQNKPLVLDRLCLRAVSIFHLAHWRDNVTTQSYYLD